LTDEKEFAGLTPSGAFDHVKESIAEYLETQYRVSSRPVFRDRGEMLRARGTIAQWPFIEATPAFAAGRKLGDLERDGAVPAGTTELVLHGVPVDRFALYSHQEAAILAAAGDKPNLLVATGTGSGKTEAFLIPILADILREAAIWPRPIDPERRGTYDGRAGKWLHSRRHERRPAALRAIVLYPMNALVNDQLSRLRRILARGDSPDWQRRNLMGNVVRFGMYTSLTRPTGPWTEAGRRTRFAEYEAKLDDEWQALPERLRTTGGWPRPDSPEMLCRWDMQLAPPDVLVTNYSMLEYMLVRPIEAGIFDATREWLASDSSNRLTLVLDEAHTYTGARGTEVAHLVRRLKERLGIADRPGKFRAIATSASVPNVEGGTDQIVGFASSLFGVNPDAFSVVRIDAPQTSTPAETDQAELDSWVRFHRAFNLRNPIPAIEGLARDLNLGDVDRTLEPQVALAGLLEAHPSLSWVRSRTARRATLFDDLSSELFGGLGSSDTREEAIAGILAAGSFARPSALPDTPPLLSMRIHGFLRGIAGIWACINPRCDQVPAEARPVGKVFGEPRLWCDCGARVLEVFSCRKCGLLYVGGVPDSVSGSLWPWADDLSGDRQDLGSYRIFGVEAPNADLIPSNRSTRTTLATTSGDEWARDVWESMGAVDDQGQEISPFPNQCPRCQNYRMPGAVGPNTREVIEPLRTRGPRTFSVVVEDGLRVQPRGAEGDAPNFGRKALLFSDSRNDAATLAADIRRDHSNDVFRQLVYRALYVCPKCDGTGTVEASDTYRIGQEQPVGTKACDACDGKGLNSAPTALTYPELKARVVSQQLERGIPPGGDRVPDFFSKVAAGAPGVGDVAGMWFDLNLRRELSEEAFSLGPLGLASWDVRLPDETGEFPALNQDESKIFVRTIARILATEDVLLPPEPLDPWGWPKDLVESHERQVIIPGYARSGSAIPYNLQNKRKLGRYVIAVSRALVAENRLPDDAAADRWVKDLRWPLWTALKAFNVLQWAGAKINGEVPQGIRIDSFALRPIDDVIYLCASCAYVTSEVLFGVCPRCGQRAEPASGGDIRNFFRRNALAVRPDGPFDDPYPLRAIEHTAQIPGAEARDLERWFQDFFRDDENPLDHRIDVLSVTTTMEMGIDIGSLLSVGLRNVPPTVANYQQRAGRAGRRGSSVATVLTYAQPRSHDQYYFDRPPQIVSEPPRVPVLYLDNPVIARRHVRALVLESFFRTSYRSPSISNLFAAWGTVGDFVAQQGLGKLIKFIADNAKSLGERSGLVVAESFGADLEDWVRAIPGEIGNAVNTSAAEAELLPEVLDAGLLPKYAFPIDVVSLWIPNMDRGSRDEPTDSDNMQRDLKIALSEYAPGAEVVRGTFPETFIYKSAGLYDPFGTPADYGPDGTIVECLDCQAIDVEAMPQWTACKECGGGNIQIMPFVTPKGFTVDAALGGAGRQRYEGGGRERSGSVAPARLLVGGNAFTLGASSVFDSLYTFVREGDLLVCNKGPDRNFPGYLICRTCGRSIDPDAVGSHTYPADVPPHRGNRRGPRAGTLCPNTSNFDNQVVLAHRFHSEVVLLAVDLPDSLDAPFLQPSGRAAWYSFGTLVADAASRFLQIDPDEIEVGVRAVQRTDGRLHGEVFIYDDVPGGAGYARGIAANLRDILSLAQELASSCPNSTCTGACYHCLLEYGNQQQHPWLDRNLGGSVLDYVIDGRTPSLDVAEIRRSADALAAYAKVGWVVAAPAATDPAEFSLILTAPDNSRIGLWVLHPLQGRPSPAERQALLAASGIRPAVHTTFDLQRRPFWVVNNLL
jgi:ATP-dependent helicase YprA (DUF1998 family)